MLYTCHVPEGPAGYILKTLRVDLPVPCSRVNVQERCWIDSGSFRMFLAVFVDFTSFGVPGGGILVTLALIWRPRGAQGVPGGSLGALGEALGGPGGHFGRPRGPKRRFCAGFGVYLGSQNGSKGVQNAKSRFLKIMK